MALRVWTGLLTAALSLFLVLPSVKCRDLKSPVLIRCVFVNRANITCHWEPGDPQTTHYTLNVQRIIHDEKAWNCSTPNTSCAVKIDMSVSVNFNFCVNVTAHSRHGSITSQQRCQLGIDEVMLHPVILDSAASVDGKPKCLTLSWHEEPALFLITESEVEGGLLESQIQFTALETPFSHKEERNVTVNSGTFVTCHFSPDTLYSVRLRNRYRSGTGPWSQWSNEVKSKTTEAAPSSAPMFWRQVIHQNRSRLTSLLWKPLPHALANGRILFYNVTCQDENAEVLVDQGNCTDLKVSHTSCVLNLPLGPCSCSISASTLVGTSSKALIWLRKADEKELPAPLLLSVNAVDNRSFEVKWAHPSVAAVSISGFVLEWFVVTQENKNLLHWQHVNKTKTSVVITEGVKPFQRYAICVIAMYQKDGTRQSRTEFVYTREKAPSAGPQLDAQATGRLVTLHWSIAVEELHGFIQNYTLFYRTIDQPNKTEVLPGTLGSYSLTLPPGVYEFQIRANTGGGAGKIGPVASVNIGPEEFSVVVYILLPIAVISLLLIAMLCVFQSRTVKEKLCQKVPDPSLSTLAKWSPQAVMRINVTNTYTNYSQVVVLSDLAADNSDTDQDKECYIFPYSTSANPNLSKDDRKSQRSSWTTNIADTNIADTNFTSCPVIYSTLLFQSEPTPSSSSSSELQRHSYPDVRLYSQPHEGSREPCHLYREAALDQTQCLNLACPLSLLQSGVFPEEDPMQHITFPNTLFTDLTNLSQSSGQCDPYLPV